MAYSHGENMRHVAPLAHGVADLRAGLEHDRLHAAFKDVRRGGEADGAGAQDGDGLWLGE